MSVRLTTSYESASLTDAAAESLQETYAANRELYDRVASRIDGLRGYWLASDRDTQIEILRKAYVYAALTANTQLQFADEAYGRWLAGESIEAACRETAAIPDNRGVFMAETLESFVERVESVRVAMNDRDWFRAGELARYEPLKGLSRIKGHFMVALVTGKTACIDTHTANFLESACDVSINPNRMDEYRTGVSALETAMDGMDVFMVQWLTFDSERGTAESHDLFYESLDTPT